MAYYDDLKKFKNRIAAIDDSGRMIIKNGFYTEDGAIRYYIDDVMDEEHMLDIYDYFLEESETDSLDEAVEELGEDYPERDIRLVRIKFLSEMAN